MNKFINSEMTFMEFFHQKWYIFNICGHFAVYNTYFKIKSELMTPTETANYILSQDFFHNGWALN